MPGPVGLRSDSRSIPAFQLAERWLVLVPSGPHHMVVPALAIPYFAVCPRDSHAALSHFGNHRLDEPFRADVLSGFHVPGRPVQGTPLARRRIDRHFRGVAPCQQRIVLAMVLDWLSTGAILRRDG